jgi:hypothetical protein
MASAPPSYDVAVSKSNVDDNIIINKGIIQPSIKNEEVEKIDENDERPLQSSLDDYPKGFPENHFIAWTVMRIALMTVGVPVMCRRSRRIRCHGHGGSCGHYIQDRPCTLRKESKCGRRRHEKRRARSCCNDHCSRHY